MNWNRPFAPKFLKNFDDYLLQNKPETWSTRAHWVWYYGILFCFILTGICFIYPNDSRANSGVVFWIFFVSIIGLLTFIVWLIYLLRFNVFKRFGNITGINRLKVFCLYFFSIVIIVFFSFVPMLVESFKANNKYDDNEIVNDINQYNILWNQLEYDSVDHNWQNDYFIKTDFGSNSLTNIAKEQFKQYEKTKDYYNTIDSFELARKLEIGDTIVHIKDSLYKIYTMPKYLFLEYSDADIYSKVKLLSNKEMYNKVIKNFKRPNITIAKKQIEQIFLKYKYKHNNGFYEDDYDEDLNNETNYRSNYIKRANNFSDTSYTYRVRHRYKLNTTEHSIRNIFERKNYFKDGNVFFVIRFLYYTSLILTLLIFTFRHSTKRTYFLGILSAFVLTVLTSLVLAFSRADFIDVLWTLVFYIILFLCIAIITHFTRTRSIVCGIGINLFVFVFPALPLIIAAIINTKLEEKENVKRIFDPTFSIDREVYIRNFCIAEVCSIILIIVLIPTLIHKLYRKWYALPEQ